jgi:predicted transcriptional regulator
MSQGNRPLRTRTRIGGSIKTPIWDALGDLAEKTRIPKSRLMEEAFEDLLTKYGVSVAEKQAEGPEEEK